MLRPVQIKIRLPQQPQRNSRGRYAQRKTTSTKEKVTIKTAQLTVEVILQTGAVRFYDQNGKRSSQRKPEAAEASPCSIRRTEVLADHTKLPEQRAHCLLRPRPAPGRPLSIITGQQVTLPQNNTEVAVLFLLSNKNYGILWDNYSITTIGDIRPHHELGALRLYSRNGEQGWLTATYYKDREGKTPLLQRPENSIGIAFWMIINNSSQPTSTLREGLVTWEGDISSGFNGHHKIRMTYGGYIKVWIDGKLVLDKWRRSRILHPP